MVLDVTTWTAKFCATDSVLEKLVFHSPIALLSGLRRVRVTVLFGLVVGLMLNAELFSESNCLLSSHRPPRFERACYNEEFGSRKGLAAVGVGYNGYRPKSAVDLQPLLAAAHRPLHHVAIRLLADQRTASDDELTVRNEPKHCGARSCRAARPGLFPLKQPSWCDNYECTFSTKDPSYSPNQCCSCPLASSLQLRSAYRK